MAEIDIIAYHGWGFSRNFWQPWHELIPDHISWKNFDRGYFGRPNVPEFSPNASKKIVITHSFGLHFCSAEIIAEADLFIIMSGFLSFHPQAAQFKRRSRQVVGEMIDRFKQQPDQVLNDFYENVFSPQEPANLPSKKQKDQARLLKDLKLLNSNKQSLAGLQKNANVFILHGTDDGIVPKRKGRTLFEKLGDIGKYFEIKNAGHALPVTHSEPCWKIVRSEFE